VGTSVGFEDAAENVNGPDVSKPETKNGIGPVVSFFRACQSGIWLILGGFISAGTAGRELSRKSTTGKQSKKLK